MRFALSLILFASPLFAAEFWISPSGSPHAAGSRQDPWALASALLQPPAVAPGDTLWLLPGVYLLQQPLISRLAGSPTQPIRPSCSARRTRHARLRRSIGHR